MKYIMAVLALMMVMSVTALVTETVSDNERIVVTLITQEPDPVAPGSTFDAYFRIENRGAEPSPNMDVKLGLDYPFSLYSDDEVHFIGTVAGGQKDEIGAREKFTVRVDPDAVAGTHTIEFWYRTDNGAWVKAGDYDIEVRSRDAVLAINKITTTPKTVVPGEITKVAFTLENIADGVLKDIRLRLDVYTELATASSITFRELPFTPVGSGNEKTVNTLKAGASQNVIFDLVTDADAASKVYKLPYSLSYTDEAGTNFTRTGVVALIVDPDPIVSVSLDSTDIYTDNAKGTVTIKFVNKGFSDIKFLDASLGESEHYDILSNEDVYLGNVDSDDYETADFDLLLKNGGKDLDLPLHVEYRDANGELFSEDHMIKIKLYSGSELKKRQGKSGNGLIGIAIIIVIVAVGIYIYRKRKKKKA